MDTKLPPAVRTFLRRVQQRYHPTRVILFGSRARGDAHHDSDYDFIIVSPAFESIDFYERHVQIAALLHLPVAIEPICLTPEELATRSKEIGLIRVATKEGIDLPIRQGSASRTRSSRSRSLVQRG